MHAAGINELLFHAYSPNLLALTLQPAQSASCFSVGSGDGAVSEQFPLSKKIQERRGSLGLLQKHHSDCFERGRVTGKCLVLSLVIF